MGSWGGAESRLGLLPLVPFFFFFGAAISMCACRRAGVWGVEHVAYGLSPSGELK